MTIRNPAPAASSSFEYRLQRSPVGVVILDGERRIRSVNPLAERLLARGGSPVVGADILDLHPPAARPKVEWLIGAAQAAADGTASMVVTTPMGSLVTQVTVLHGDAGVCMMFHPLGEHPMAEQAESPPHLLKLPVIKGGKTALIDVGEVVSLSAQGHYSRAATRTQAHLCPLPLAESERRLDPLLFVRIHRGHLVNLRHAVAADRAEGRWTIMMDTDPPSRVPVSRDKVDLIRRLLAV